MKIKVAAILAGLAFFAASTAMAGTITFNFSSCSEITSPPTTSANCPNADLGTNFAVYTVGTSSIEALGFSSSGVTNPNNLYVKDKGTGEMGLGLNGTLNNEVNAGQYIYLELAGIVGSTDSGTLLISSAQAGEGATVCLTNAVGTPGTPCTTMTGPGTNSVLSFPVTWNSTNDILSVTASAGNVLVGETITATTVPESGSLVLFGTGTMLLGVGFLYSRLRRAKASS